MAIKSKEEILNAIKEIIGDSTGDLEISLIEDVSDTLDSFSNTGNENWKEKYVELDKNWRQKYRDRFFNSSDNELECEEEDDEKSYTYDELFDEEDV